MNIKILGTGCPKCNALAKVTQDAIDALSIDANVDKVQDIMEIMQYNIMITPALVIDEKVVLKGKVPSLEEMKNILTGA